MTNSTFIADTQAIAGSVNLSALVGLLPLIAFFVLLGVFKLSTHVCAIGSLLLAGFIAIVGFGMPADLTALSALQGLAFGTVPILYIVVTAVWLYNLTVTSGREADVRAIFSSVGAGDKRVQALLISFCFVGLLEGLAGFGAPVAIGAAMLYSLGLGAIKAAVLAMVGNAVSVAFGAMGIGITTAAKLGMSTPDGVASATATLTPWVAVAVPFLLLFIADGVRGIRDLWSVGLAVGMTMGFGNWFAANYISFELVAVLSALLALSVGALVARALPLSTPQEMRSVSSEPQALSPRRAALALAPYVLVVIVLGISKLWKIGINIPATLSSTDIPIEWPGLYGRLLTTDGEPSTSAIYNFTWLSSPGTMIALTALIVIAVYASADRSFRVSAGLKTLVTTIVTLRWSLITITLVMALAYVMNFSGQTLAIGTALAATGSAFAFLSPVLGWIGTAVTGSATASNALFANLQATAATQTGLTVDTLLAANTLGGGLGKIISPQNLTIAANSVAKPGAEAEILRKVVPYSLALIGLLAIVVVFLA